MIQFTSKREKKLWLGVLIVVIGIYALIFIGRPLAGYLRDREMLSNGFWLAIFLVAATVAWHGWKRRVHYLEIGIWLGVIAIYLLAFLRMAVPEERSHLIEYSVLAIFIYEALKERVRNGQYVWKPAIFSIIATSLIGLVDECIQILIPARVFDPIDIFFNTLASILAIGASTTISWVRQKVKI